MGGRLLGVLGGMGPLASAELVHTIYRLNVAEPEQGSPALLLRSDPSIPDRQRYRSRNPSVRSPRRRSRLRTRSRVYWKRRSLRPTAEAGHKASRGHAAQANGSNDAWIRSLPSLVDRGAWPPGQRATWPRSSSSKSSSVSLPCWLPLGGIAGAIILGSTLSFLGLGVKPPAPEWGNMLSDGRTMMRHHWWVSFFPGLAIMLTVLAINLFGDGLRDAIDPRMRGR